MLVFIICRDGKHSEDRKCKITLTFLNDISYRTVQMGLVHKGNNKITELRTILQRESQNS